jgi:broad specificity phosphatase PhoE
MGTLYLVRHGQASFGADDYDQLSELGIKQAERLGAYFAGKGLQFDAAYTGTLKRQVQTLAGICKGGGYSLPSQERPGLNEYDSEAVIGAIHPHKLVKPTSTDEYRSHFRLLRDGLAQWMAGVVTPKGMPTYADWRKGIVDTMDLVRASAHSNVLIVSSGGPISTVVGHILGTSPETTIDLNMRIRNSSVTEFAFTPKRHILVTYNTLPHLDDKALESWITYT